MSLRWVSGNRITLLENGDEFYPRAFAAIEAAEREVLLETFILCDDKVGRGLQQALLKAAARGADVHVLVDGWASDGLPTSFVRSLLDAGVKLRSFEPAQRLFGARINMLRRMHRKLLVVDGEFAFVGGINYSIEHLAEAGPIAMQDYAIEVEGPLVGQIHAFCRASLDSPQPPRRSWLQRWRERRAGRPAGDVEAVDDSRSGSRAAFVTRDNDRHRTDIERQYRAALRGAREHVLIANAYFFPGYRLLRDLRRAARRGVQVDLVLQGRPDVPGVQHVASLLYGHLLRAGVRIHEFCERPLHAKVAVVDDRWATIGSSNLDPTSLGLNLEANVVLDDRDFALELRRRLDHLIAERCRRVQLPPAGRLRSAWIGLRSVVVFHVMRRYPSWARQLPAQEPRVAAMRSDPS